MPPDLCDRLTRRAEANHRSLKGEILALLDTRQSIA
ncbi:MAG: Arc family DNA-binding protein [Rhodothermales bacterium]